MNQTVFGEDPPVDIWPDTDTRFSSDLECRWVNTGSYWLIPKPRRVLERLLRSHRRGTIALGMVPSLFAAWNPFDLAGPQFLLLYGFAYLTSVMVVLLLRQSAPGDKDPIDAASIGDPHEVAYLAGGTPRVAQVATGSLVHRGVLEVEGSQKRLVANLPLPDDAHDIERAVFAAVIATEGKAEGRRFDFFAATALRNIRRQLADKGLIENASSFAGARFASLLAMCPVLGLGLIKLAVGISRDRPVGYLVVGLVLTVMTMAALAVRPRCTVAGRALLRRLRHEFHHHDAAQPLTTEKRSPTDLAYGIALLGVGSALGPADPLLKLFAPRGGFHAGRCSAGSECGGGGCGGCGG